MSKQLNLFKSEKVRRLHGGEVGLGKRKLRRPIDTKNPIHIVLRSEKAKGRLSLLNHQAFIVKCLGEFSRKFRISIYEKAIVGNHIHLLIRGKTRSEIQNFFRTVAALIARQVTGAKKGNPFGKFWSRLLFSRLLSSWGKEFETVKAYIIKNTLEALGQIRYVSRRREGYKSG